MYYGVSHLGKKRGKMSYSDSTKSIMHLLLFIMLLGIFWLIVIELKRGDILELTDLLAWLVIIFVIPLTLMNFHDEAPWFTLGSVLFALIYSILSLAQLLVLPDKNCCLICGLIILILSMLACMTIIVLGAKDLLKYRRNC